MHKNYSPKLEAIHSLLLTLIITTLIILSFFIGGKLFIASYNKLRLDPLPLPHQQLEQIKKEILRQIRKEIKKEDNINILNGGIMWEHYELVMDFEEKLCGSVPLSKELVSTWLNARKPNQKPDNARSIEELEQEVIESIEDDIERTTVGFQADEDGLFVRGATIRSHLKDCANQIKDLVKIKAFKAKLSNRLYILEYKVHLLKDDQRITECDGTFEQPIHAMTPRGPINALKVVQYIENPRLKCTLKILNDGNKEITLENIEKILEYGSIHGYGGERSMGEGRYSFSLL